MPGSIVIELQQLASDGKCSIAELLRHALIVATKLQIGDFRQWISDELNGYPKEAELPSYRTISTTLPVVTTTAQLPHSIFQTHPCKNMNVEHRVLDPVTAIQRHVEAGCEVAKIPFRHLDGTVTDELLQTVLRDCGLSAVGLSDLNQILDSVRNTILEWSLRLEQQGIRGEGMGFNSKEKEIAMTSQSIHIGSFQGILGPVNESTVTQNLQMTVTAGDFNSLQETLTKAGIEPADLVVLKDALTTDPKPTAPGSYGPQTATWIGGMLTKAASGAWKISLDTATKLLTTSLAAYYGLKG